MGRIARLIKGGALTASSIVPTYITKIIPGRYRKFRSVGYAASAGLAGYGLWNLYKGITGTPAEPSEPGESYRCKILDPSEGEEWLDWMKPHTFNFLVNNPYGEKKRLEVKGTLWIALGTWREKKKKLTKHIEAKPGQSKWAVPMFFYPWERGEAKVKFELWSTSDHSKVGDSGWRHFKVV